MDGRCDVWKDAWCCPPTCGRQWGWELFVVQQTLLVLIGNLYAAPTNGQPAAVSLIPARRT